ncbi:RNA recognition motif domain-containing protein [Ditylenchus destructor]|uniref:RNA recognition motif domain-containing protein n=1 Tax=Ditylenchus destructor TaxID=166010 RepID=A0AAD4MV88_9BILA|nr:RNA recognition motif domain-containing protein [Ditylenchus destructor]
MPTAISGLIGLFGSKGCSGVDVLSSLTFQGRRSGAPHPTTGLARHLRWLVMFMGIPSKNGSSFNFPNGFPISDVTNVCPERLHFSSSPKDSVNYPDEYISHPTVPVIPPDHFRWRISSKNGSSIDVSNGFPNSDAANVSPERFHFSSSPVPAQLNSTLMSDPDHQLDSTRDETATFFIKDSLAANQNYSDEYIFSSKKRYDVNRTIFVGGLTKFTTEKSLYQYFLQFGTISGCRLARNKLTKASKGYGFVEFASVEQAKSTCKVPHKIDGQEVDVKLSGLKELRQKFTLFVGGLSKETSVETLREYFSKFGQLTECEIKLDRQTGQSRGFGFVAFSSQKELDSALDAEPHVIDGTRVKLNYVTSEFDVFVTCLHSNITETALNEFFSHYGQLRRCEIKETSIGVRTGFVGFWSEKDLLQALSDRPHIINGKLVGTFQKDQQFSIFVGNLPSDATDDSLSEIFSKYGKIVHWEVKRDRNTNRSRGIGYVSFEKAEEAVQALNGGPYILNGRTLSVKPCKTLPLSKKSFE